MPPKKCKPGRCLAHDLRPLQSLGQDLAMQKRARPPPEQTTVASQRPTSRRRRTKAEWLRGNVAQAKSQVQAPVSASWVDLADLDAPLLLDPHLLLMRDPLESLNATHRIITGDFLPAPMLDAPIIVKLDIATITHVSWPTPEIFA